MTTGRSFPSGRYGCIRLTLLTSAPAACSSRSASPTHRPLSNSARDPSDSPAGLLRSVQNECRVRHEAFHLLLIVCQRPTYDQPRLGRSSVTSRGQAPRCSTTSSGSNFARRPFVHLHGTHCMRAANLIRCSDTPRILPMARADTVPGCWADIIK